MRTLVVACDISVGRTVIYCSLDADWDTPSGASRVAHTERVFTTRTAGGTDSRRAAAGRGLPWNLAAPTEC
jgi:hypothetical protein